MKRHLASLLLAGLTGAVAMILAPAIASAHGSITSNLAEQRFEVAPDHAEFTADVPVDLATAKAKLRYLGNVEVSSDLYFADDVPTLELELVVGAPGTTFAFDLPELGAGTYALDWEVTPIGDHSDQAVQLFVVTVGSSNPDPVPPVPQDTATVASESEVPVVPVDNRSNTFIYLLACAVVAAVSAAVISIVARRWRRK
jgi:hypothetical protein